MNKVPKPVLKDSINLTRRPDGRAGFHGRPTFLGSPAFFVPCKAEGNEIIRTGNLQMEVTQEYYRFGPLYLESDEEING